MNIPPTKLDQLETLAAAGEQVVESFGSDLPQRWRALVVCSYFTGLRTGDLLDLSWSNVDLEAATLSLTLRKTAGYVCLPLHPVVVNHLQGLNYREGNLFGIDREQLAGLEQLFGPTEVNMSDLRQLACSAIEQTAPGFGSPLLAHSGASVEFDQLRLAVEAMPYPNTWTGGDA